VHEGVLLLAIQNDVARMILIRCQARPPRDVADSAAMANGSLSGDESEAGSEERDGKAANGEGGNVTIDTDDSCDGSQVWVSFLSSLYTICVFPNTRNSTKRPTLCTRLKS
jgi:hypothetical protein